MNTHTLYDARYPAYIWLVSFASFWRFIKCWEPDEIYLNEKYILLYGSQEINWTDAENYCVSNYNSHLASVHSPSDNDSLIILRENNGLYHIGWIGLSDLGNESIWSWTDGTDNSYVNWDLPYEPNGGSNENCVDVQLSGQGHWNDYPCSETCNIFWCNVVANDTYNVSTITPTLIPSAYPSIISTLNNTNSNSYTDSKESSSSTVKESTIASFEFEYETTVNIGSKNSDDSNSNNVNNDTLFLVIVILSIVCGTILIIVIVCSISVNRTKKIQLEKKKIESDLMTMKLQQMNNNKTLLMLSQKQNMHVIMNIESPVPSPNINLMNTTGNNINVNQHEGKTSEKNEIGDTGNSYNHNHTHNINNVNQTVHHDPNAMWSDTDDTMVNQGQTHTEGETVEHIDKIDNDENDSKEMLKSKDHDTCETKEN